MPVYVYIYIYRQIDQQLGELWYFNALGNNGTFPRRHVLYFVYQEKARQFYEAQRFKLWKRRPLENLPLGT